MNLETNSYLFKVIRAYLLSSIKLSMYQEGPDVSFSNNPLSSLINLTDEEVNALIDLSKDPEINRLICSIGFDAAMSYLDEMTVSILANSRYKKEYALRILRNFLELIDGIKKKNPVPEYMVSDLLPSWGPAFMSDHPFIKVIQKKEKGDLADFEKLLDENFESCLIPIYTGPKRDYKYLIYPLFQINFPFSYEFMEKHKEHFFIRYLVNNVSVNKNIEIQKLVFKDILEENLNFVKDYCTEHCNHDRISVSDEERDNLILQYNLN